jgi:hypothetical protein
LATVSHWEYTQYDGTSFPPGTTRTLAWGPWPWAVKGVIVTAHPFDLSTAYRALTVDDIELRTTPATPVADKWLYATVRNVGSDPIVIWYVSLDVIAP